MTAKFVVLIAFLALASGRLTRRDAPTPANNDLQEAKRIAAEFDKTFNENFNSNLNSQSTVNTARKGEVGEPDSVLQQLAQLRASQPPPHRGVVASALQPSRA